MLLLISNLLCSMFVVIKNMGDYNLVYTTSNSIKLSIAYIVLSIFIGCIVGLIIVICHKYFNINVEVKNEKEKGIKNNK